jgi:uncharacterized protein
MNAQRRLLSPGRWHFQHGPIDILAQAGGDAECVAAAHEAAWQRFACVLTELVSELPVLKQTVPEHSVCPLRGAVAQRMWRACQPHAGAGLTPMAAVAGAVAQELIAAYERAGIERAWVNNGGDIALHLAAGQSLRLGLVADVSSPRWDAKKHQLVCDGWAELTSDMPVRGVATSGWRGRSFSLGIADSVTVLAATAAQADAAATVIANAVNVQDARIVRRPASSLKDDSDLGDALVTVDVPELPADRVAGALQAGARVARNLQARGLIAAANLVCQGQVRAVDFIKNDSCSGRDSLGRSHFSSLNTAECSSLESAYA